jgi:hypothetical protein
MTSCSPPYSPKTRPWAHQAQALERLRGRSYFALTMAMRTGKTKVILDDFGRLWAAGHVDDLLVIAPAGVYRFPAPGQALVCPRGGQQGGREAVAAIHDP